MIKDKQITIQVTYCDYCGKEGVSWYIDKIDGKDFHRHAFKGETETCYEKYIKQND